MCGGLDSCSVSWVLSAEGAAGGGDYEAELLEWEERGIWYTPSDADVDVEGD